jgi:hypothetical protein
VQKLVPTRSKQTKKNTEKRCLLQQTEAEKFTAADDESKMCATAAAGNDTTGKWRLCYRFKATATIEIIASPTNFFFFSSTIHFKFLKRRFEGHSKFLASWFFVCVLQQMAFLAADSDCCKSVIYIKLNIKYIY